MGSRLHAGRRDHRHHPPSIRLARVVSGRRSSGVLHPLDPAQGERARDLDRQNRYASHYKSLCPPLARRTFLATALATSVLFAYWGLNAWLPGFLSAPQSQGGAGLNILQTSGWIFVMQFGAFLGYVGFGWMADRFGRRPAFFGYVLAAAVLTPVYGLTPRWAGASSRPVLLVLGPLIGFCGTGFFALFGAMLAELYPLRFVEPRKASSTTSAEPPVRSRPLPWELWPTVRHRRCIGARFRIFPDRVRPHFHASRNQEHQADLNSFHNFLARTSAASSRRIDRARISRRPQYCRFGEPRRAKLSRKAPCLAWLPRFTRTSLIRTPADPPEADHSEPTQPHTPCPRALPRAPNSRKIDSRAGFKLKMPFTSATPIDPSRSGRISASASQNTAL